MANNTQRNDAAPKTQPDKDSQKGQPEKQTADEKSALEHPPVKQVNPDHGGLNPDHLGPAQPRKPGE